MSQDWIYVSEGDGDWEVYLKPEEENVAAEYQSGSDTEEVEDVIQTSPTPEMTSIKTQLKKNNSEVEELKAKVCNLEDQIEEIKREFSVKLAHHKSTVSSEGTKQLDLPRDLTNGSLLKNLAHKTPSERPRSSWRRWPRGLLGAIIGFTTVGIFASVVMLISTVHLLSKCCTSLASHSFHCIADDFIIMEP